MPLLIFLVKPFDVFKYLKGKRVLMYNFEELVTLSDSLSLGDMHEYFDIVLTQHLISSEKRENGIKDFAFEYSTKVLSEKVKPSSLQDILDTIGDTYDGLKGKINDLELYEYTRSSIERYLKPENGHIYASLSKIEIPISLILSKMERRGIRVDRERLEILKNDIEKEIEGISKEIFNIVGHEFNINSPKQLSDVLFKELGLPNKSKGSTRESVLSSMLGMHPIVEQLLYFRETTKILNTYVEPLYKGCAEEDGVYSIHTDFKQTGTTSGRFSSVNPNLQNLPLDGVWATRVRECFVARNGFKLLAIDYSQMELNYGRYI